MLNSEALRLGVFRRASGSRHRLAMRELRGEESGCWFLGWGESLLCLGVAAHTLAVGLVKDADFKTSIVTSLLASRLDRPSRRWGTVVSGLVPPRRGPSRLPVVPHGVLNLDCSKAEAKHQVSSYSRVRCGR